MADVNYLFTAEFYFFLFPGTFRRRLGWRSLSNIHPKVPPISSPGHKRPAGVVQGLHAPPTGITIPRKRLDQYLILLAICGRPVPGIPLASALPLCPIDRVRQIHWMYCTLLTFLRCVGLTCVSSHQRCPRTRDVQKSGNFL